MTVTMQMPAADVDYIAPMLLQIKQEFEQEPAFHGLDRSIQQQMILAELQHRQNLRHQRLLEEQEGRLRAGRVAAARRAAAERAAEAARRPRAAGALQMLLSWFALAACAAAFYKMNTSDPDAMLPLLEAVFDAAFPLFAAVFAGLVLAALAASLVALLMKIWSWLSSAATFIVERLRAKRTEAARRAAAEAEEAAANQGLGLRGPFVRVLCLVAVQLFLASLVIVDLPFTPVEGPAMNQTAAIDDLEPVPAPREPVLQNLFLFDGPFVEQAMSPARLTDVQGEAWYEIFGSPADDEEEEDCCAVDDLYCRLSAVAPTYIPSFLAPYLLGEPPVVDEEEDEPMDSFYWVVDVCDQSIWKGFTPAILPHGPMEENSGVAFFQMTQGHSRNPEPEESDYQHEIEDQILFEVCPESDSLISIVKRAFTFYPNSILQETTNWLSTAPNARATSFEGLRDVAAARFREQPAIHLHYQAQGTLLYEATKSKFNYESHCAETWTAYPALRPKTLWEKFRDDFSNNHNHHHNKLPPIKQRSCYDHSPASGGADPVEVAMCHAFARDPQPVDYSNFEETPMTSFLNLSDTVVEHMEALPNVDETCMTREFVKYEFMQSLFDYSDICAELKDKKHPDPGLESFCFFMLRSHRTHNPTNAPTPPKLVPFLFPTMAPFLLNILHSN